jgi:hypothetical protein
MGNKARNVGILKDRLHLGRAETKIEDHGYCSDFQDGKVSHNEFRGVLKKEDNAISLFDSNVEESIGHSIGEGV